jgi:hypothetical protein
MAALTRAGTTKQASTMLRLQRQVGNAAVARAVQRQAAAAAPAAPATAAGTGGAGGTQDTGTSDATGRLSSLITKIEHLHADVAARVAADGPDEQAESQLAAVVSVLEQLRVAATSDDDELKLRVLAGFTAARLSQAEQQLAGPASPLSSEAAAEPLAAPAAAPPSVAAKRRGLARAPQPVGRRNVSRQGAEAVIAAGWALLAADAEAAPAEAAAGPPGWVFGAAVAVVALAVIGTGYVMMASQGNVADTGIVNDANALIAAGLAATMCAALAQLMDAASRARDTARMGKIKATQKAKGCRHSRHSE